MWATPKHCPSGGRVTAKQLSTGAAYPQPYFKVYLQERCYRSEGFIPVVRPPRTGRMWNFGHSL